MKITIFAILAVATLAASGLIAQSSRAWINCDPGWKAYTDAFVSFCYPSNWLELPSKNPRVRQEVVLGPRDRVSLNSSGDAELRGGIALSYLDKSEVNMNLAPEAFVDAVLRKATTESFRKVVFGERLSTPLYDELGGEKGVRVFNNSAGTMLTLVTPGDTVLMFWRVLPEGAAGQAIGSDVDKIRKTIVVSPPRPHVPISSVATSGDADKVLGRWRKRTMSSQVMYDVDLTFKSDGRLVYALGPSEQGGRYTLNGNELRLIYDRAPAQICDCQISGDAMYLLCATAGKTPAQMDPSFRQVFHRVR